VVDARILAPAADGIVAGVAFDELIVRPHGAGEEGEGLGEGGFGDDEIGVFEQVAVGTKDEFFGERFGVEGLAEFDAEVLDFGFGFGVDEGELEGFFGDFEVGFEEEGGELEGFFIVDEAVGGDGVGGEDFGEVVVEFKEVAEGVAILGDGEAANDAVFGGGAGAGGFERLVDPGDDALAVFGGGLGEAFGGHGAFFDAMADGFPEADVLIFEVGAELVDADAGGAVIDVVALETVLFEEGFDGLVEGGGGGLGGEPGDG